LEGLGINLGYLLVQIFNFLLVLVVLRAWVYKPVLGMLKRRRETIAQGLEDARVAAEARDNAEQEAEVILTEARVKANEQIAEATERAEEIAQEIRSSAEEDAQEIKAIAREEAKQEQSQMLSDLRNQVASLAVAAAQKVIGQALDESRQRALIDEFFSGVKEGEVVLLEESEDLRGESAEVTSALPLTSEERDAVKREVVDQLGGEATISFRVDPSIMGGLVIRVGDRVLDGSVAGKLEGLRQTLQ
jgi:F-type H+-transporting ATPase subunit b